MGFTSALKSTLSLPHPQHTKISRAEQAEIVRKALIPLNLDE
jgi:hypothetical protein